MPLLSFQVWREAWINIPAGLNNAESPFGSKCASKWATSDSEGKEASAKQKGEKTPERKYGKKETRINLQVGQLA